MPSNSLEQEAMERVARMYSSFDRRPPQHRPPRPAQQAKPESKHESEPAQSEKEPERAQSAARPENRGLLELLMKDREQSLIMILLIILMKDGADMNLLLALVYLLI